MSLRAFLQSQGLSEKDIDEAVNEARGVAEMVHSGSNIAATILVNASEKVKNEKVQRLLIMGTGFAMKVRDGAAELLKKR